MRHQVRLTKTEIFLLLLTVIFLVTMAALLAWERQSGGGSSYEVTTQYRAEPSGGQVLTVNINTATAAELETLSGIGEVLAQRIIDYRTEKGGFSSVEELKEVRGIGDAVLANNEGRITIGEEEAAQ